MVAPVRRMTILLLVMIFSAIAMCGSLAQEFDGARYFPQTGHLVQDEFFTYYLSAANPAAVFGYPITDAYLQNGIKIQYFERARFEQRPDAPADLPVTLTSLGFLLFDPKNPGQIVAVSPGLPDCRTFPETGFQVCYAFLEFFDQNGGTALFGNPISDIVIQDGWMVQYFLRARFEWHPERPSGQRVVLSDLGRIYFNQNEDPALLRPNLDSLTSQVVLSIKAQAFVAQSVLSNGEMQTVTVIVKDQNYLPIANAQVTVVTQPDIQGTILPLTDGNGLTRLTYPVGGLPIGLNPITVVVHYQTLQTQTITSFRIWW
jgi:hypothetical protein